MPKKAATINDFSGGLNNNTDKRDLAPNELAQCTNVDTRHRGKLTTAPKFKPNVITDRGSVVDGYGLFVYSNDYQVSDNASGYTGYYIALADGSGNIDIYQSGNTTWYDNKLTGTPSGTPAFMSAEGDLFVSGDHSATPASYIYKKREDFNLENGTDSNLGRSVSAYSAETQDKPMPTADNMRLWWASVDDGGVTGGGSNVALNANTMANTDPADAIVTDELIWVIEWGAANSGSWQNTGDKADRYIQFAATWLYKNQAESDIYEFTTPAYVGAALDNTDGAYEDASDRALRVYACINAVSETDRYGARLYARMSDEKEWYLLAEADYEKGIIGDTETEYTPWGNVQFNCQIHAQTGFVEQPPAVYSFFALNGYTPSDMPRVGTSVNRKVFWKTGVIANSRAYIGNVKINDRVYGDRIFRSPPYQYDVFTENNWIESTTNDGDQITALATYADRILMFKEQSVTVINISKVEEYVEAEQKEAGATWPAAIAQTQFGIAWANETGCFIYNGENISNLLYAKADKGQVQKIDDTVWSDSIVKPVVGFFAKTRQLIVIWDAGSSANAFMYSFDTQSWSTINDILSDDVSNMINIRGGELYIQGGAANGDINKLTTRTDASSNPTVTIETGELSFANYESKKNLSKIIFTYQGAASTSLAITGSVNGGSYGSTLATLSGGSGRHSYTLDLTSNSDYKGQKTFQFKLAGTVGAAFELEDITFIFRDLGVR